MLKKRKKRFDLAVKRSLRKKLALSVSKSDAKNEADPFLQLGYGMNSYFNIMVALMILFGSISVFMLPSMLTFSSYSALEVFTTTYGDAKYTLGNIGGADTLCKQSTYMVGETSMRLECGQGTLIDMEVLGGKTGEPVLDFGLVPAEAPINTYCSNSAITDDAYKCNILKPDDLKETLKSKCDGK